MDTHNNKCTRLGDDVNIPDETLLNELSNIYKKKCTVLFGSKLILLSYLFKTLTSVDWLNV